MNSQKNEKSASKVIKMNVLNNLPAYKVKEVLDKRAIPMQPCCRCGDMWSRGR